MSAILSIIGPILARIVEPITKLLALFGAQHVGRKRGRAEAERDQAEAGGEHQAEGARHRAGHERLGADDVRRRMHNRAGEYPRD